MINTLAPLSENQHLTGGKTCFGVSRLNILGSSSQYKKNICTGRGLKSVRTQVLAPRRSYLTITFIFEKLAQHP